MTLSETERIDFIAKSKEGEFLLAISAHLDWNKNPKTVKDLEKKLRNYIHYIEGGQFAEEYGNSPVHIEIMTAYELSPEAEQLVDRVQRTSGIAIKATVMGTFNPFK